MKRLSIDPHKGQHNRKNEDQSGKYNKIGKGENFKECKDKERPDQHNNKLPSSNRADNLVFHIDKLGYCELVHIRSKP